ncbi:Serine/threonine-protein kinase tel1 [Orbilia oligospora]|uniref:Serine/threonine-protein kinase TEL1 n=1 Tax=Orbilia oligospora TaxID=2813651 RepID=A0A7C8P1M1_ORBOL|nr:Serine/threonine-protein kinase tel1 [Orbilia oligospora]
MSEAKLTKIYGKYLSTTGISNPMLTIFMFLENLQSDKTTARQAGAKELRDKILKSDFIYNVPEKGYNKMLESLFKAAMAEKAAASRQTKDTTRRVNIAKVEDYTETIRMVVEKCSHRLNYKAVKALVAHCTQMLLAIHEDEYNSVVEEYIRVLSSLFVNRSHTEHLLKDDWVELVLLCCQYLEVRIEKERSYIPKPGSSKDRNEGFGNIGTSILNLLQTVTSTPQAFIVEGDHLPQLVDIVLVVYELRPTEIDALLTLNSVLEALTANHLEYTAKIVRRTTAYFAGNWENTKSFAMKELLVVHLILGLPHIHSLLKSPSESVLRENLTVVLGKIATGHTSGPRKNLLGINDIAFECLLPSNPIQNGPLRTSTFALRPGASGAQNEHGWMIPQLMASIIYSLQQDFEESTQAMDIDNIGGVGIKRLRLGSKLDDTLRELKDPQQASRILAMQVLTFYFDKWIPDLATAERGLETIARLCSNEDTGCASWAMLVLAVVYSNPNSKELVKSLNNLELWKTAMGNITSPSACRSACHLLRIMLSENILAFTEVRDSIDDLVSKVEAHGPALVADSTIAFWHEIVRRRRENPAISKVHLETRLFQWFLMKWRPGTMWGETENKASIPEISSIVSLCCGQEYYPYTTYPDAVSGTIGQTIERSSASLNPLSFLLLRKVGSEDAPKSQGFSSNKYWTKPAVTKRSTEAETQMIEFSSQQLDEFYEKWPISQDKENPKNISRSGAEGVTDFLAVISIFGSFLNQPETKATETFFKKLTRVRTTFEDYFSWKRIDIDVISGIMSRVNKFLPRIASHTKGLENHRWKLAEDNTLTQFLSTLDVVISSKLHLARLGLGDDEDSDGMDLDDILGDGTTAEEQAFNDMPRELYEAIGSINTAKMTIYEALRFHASVSQERDSNKAYTEFALSLAKLSPVQLILSRPIIDEFLGLELNLPRSELGVLVKSIGSKLLSVYDYERCEVGTMICIGILTNLTKLWAPQTNDDALYNNCGSIYNWLILAALDKRALSYKIRMAIAKLLKDMLSVNMEYGQTQGSKSLKTNFLRLLQDEDMRVRYLMADYLPTLFSLYSIELHARVYDDVTKYLEADIDNLEGLAMRVHSLSKLISASFHVMKNAVFHIFETAWKVPHSKPYATRAISSVAKTIKNGDPREVFGLFKSHLIHLFLQEDAKLNDEFPFSIFGYATLAELYADAEEELVAQLLMFSRDDDANEVSETLQVPYESLIRNSFHKIIAYSTAWASSSGKDNNQRSGKGTADGRIRKRLGDGPYSELVSEKLALILSTFFEIYTEDDDAEKSTQTSQEDGGNREHHLARNGALGAAWDVMKSILLINHSTTKLGQVTKPAFKPRVIVTSVNYICGKVNLGNIGTMWDAPLYTFIVRRQLEMIRESLGSMQSCVVIRTIRFIISLAGRVAVEGYPLELAIHGLIPYLTDPVCTRDTIGILQYLFTSGQDHLIKVPNFVLSSSLTILASMNSFIDTEVSTPAKQAQMLDCRDGAVAFRRWLAEYLQTYKSSTINENQQSTFQSISSAIIDSQNPGSDNILLRSLLRDENSNSEKLLNEVTKRTAYAILGANFHRSLFTAQKWVQSDKEALNIGRILFRICRSFPTSDEFLLWSARVFGRSFAASGIVLDEWTQESRVKDLLIKDSQVLPEGTASKISLLRLVETYLTSAAKDEVGVAESTIRNIVFRDASSGNGRDSIVEKYVSGQVITAMRWMAMQPPLYPLPDGPARLPESLRVSKRTDLPELKTWVKQVAIWLSSNIQDDSISANLRPLLSAVDDFSEKALPYLLHIVLLEQILSDQKQVRTQVSALFDDCFSNCSPDVIPYTSILLEGVLYLRTQRVPDEATPSERDDWIELNYRDVARAAATCNLFKIALMFVELHVSRTGKPFEDTDLLLKIYQNTGEPDSYYGVQKTQTLKSVMQRFAFENDGWKSLSFQGARLENHMLHLPPGNPIFDAETGVGTVNALSAIGLNALSFSTLQSQGEAGGAGAGGHEDNTFQTAWKLEQWDLPCPDSYTSNSSGIYKALQSINIKTEMKAVATYLNEPYLACLQQVLSPEKTSLGLSASMRTLAMLWEIEEVLSAEDGTSLRRIYDNLYSRDKWMETGSFHDVDDIYSARMAICRSMVKRAHLRANARVEIQSARLLEAKTLIKMCQISRSHSILQKSLTTSVSLSEMIGPCRDIGVEIEAAATLEAASVLWDQGETLPAIGMLQPLLEMSSQDSNYLKQAIPIGRPELLAKTATWTAEARLRKPDFVMEEYFVRAVSELEKGLVTPADGTVYHQFAMFCNSQLQDQGNLEDFQRAEKLMKQKEEEYLELERLVRSNSGPKQDSLRNYRQKAKVLLTIDREEYERLYNNRQLFLEKSLEHYLKCLITCDDYDSDATRFCSLWLEHSSNEGANEAVNAAPLAKVASRKFIPMMNQLSSRLLNDEDSFQTHLFQLIFRICRDHPYHSMYQILALDRQAIRRDNKDPSAVGRQASAKRLLRMLAEDGASSILTHNISLATQHFMNLAQEKVEKKTSSVSFRRLFPRHWKLFDQDIPKCKIAPPTMRVEVRADCSYTKTAFMKMFEPDIGIASGISMPKILACRASNGQRYKLLVKGGNDDLRQDAIMEQVFEQVSELLQKSRITRQRNLGIRTYKVVPLSTTSGIIEFVLHTVPLHEYLLPTHERYRPKDWRAGQCRNEIQKAQDKSREVRVKVFEQVMKYFQPVMRFFFFHKFVGPDEWFSKRLAYTRSTAAISILGHILGLGDRHGHNILLDERSGEVVHIDLGVAFEQGRVLPVPEVVPFRLTRDIVDGMGVTKTEGVFQRCCEFTLSVLRDEAYSVMTILDVLRYDPLYSWTISPIRAKKMQEELSVQNNDAGAKKTGETTNASEADRALTVVMKKLSKTLSVQATVNELITEAGDVRNLAVLYGE